MPISELPELTGCQLQCITASTSNPKIKMTFARMHMEKIIESVYHFIIALKQIHCFARHKQLTVSSHIYLSACELLQPFCLPLFLSLTFSGTG